MSETKTPEQIAERVLEEMRGGSLFDVSPERSRDIIAKAIREAHARGVAKERARCLAIVAGVHDRRAADAARDACSDIVERIVSGGR